MTDGEPEGIRSGILVFFKFFPCSYYSNYPNYSNCQTILE